MTQATTPVPAFAPVPLQTSQNSSRGNANLRVHSGSGFLEAQFHVVAKIGAALRPAAPAAPPAKNILESEEVSENILEFVEDGLVDAAIKAAAGKPRVTEAVIGGALLRIGKNRVGFRRLAEFFLRFLLGLRVAVRMPLQRRFAIGGLDLIRARAFQHA